MRAAIIILVSLGALIGHGAVGATHLYIQPADYRPCIGKPLNVRLLTDAATLDEFGEMRAFFVMDGRGVAPVGPPGNAGSSIDVIAPGFLLLGFRGEPQPGAVSQVPANGAVSTFAKALLLAGSEVPQRGHRRRVGFPLELVPLDNPYSYRSGMELRVAVLHHGIRVAGTPVTALAGTVETAPLVSTTDRDGVARFVFTHAGEWQLHAVVAAHSIGHPVDAFDHRASLSFELPRADTPTPAVAAGRHCSDSIPQG